MSHNLWLFGDHRDHRPVSEATGDHTKPIAENITNAIGAEMNLLNDAIGTNIFTPENQNVRTDRSHGLNATYKFLFFTDKNYYCK